MEEDQESSAQPLAVYGTVWDGGEYNLYLTSSVVDAAVVHGGGGDDDDTAGRAAPSLSCGLVLITDHYDPGLTPPRSYYDAVHLLLQRSGEIDAAMAADVSEETVSTVEAATQPTGLPYEAVYELWETLRGYILQAAVAINRNNDDVLPTNGTTPTTALVVDATFVYRATLEEEEDDGGDDDVRGDIGDEEDDEEETGTQEDDDVELLLLSAAATESSESIIDGEEDVCAVCLEKMTGGDRRALPCLHCFHGGCIVRWLRRKLQCPLCRRHVGKPTVL